jgi:hypothetical protein
MSDDLDDDMIAAYTDAARGMPAFLAKEGRQIFEIPMPILERIHAQACCAQASPVIVEGRVLARLLAELIRRREGGTE